MSKVSRAEICEIVKTIICDDRDDTHGSPEDSFQDIATLWGFYLKKELSPEDVAILMILMKIVRYMDGQPVLDHLADIAGYACIAADIMRSVDDE